MGIESYEELKISSFINIVSLNWSAPLISADFGGGYQAGAITAPYGLHKWALSAELLPDRDDTLLDYELDGVTETDPRFTYFFNFIKRHLLLGNKPFVITEPRTGLKYLVSFNTKDFSFSQITAKIFAGGAEIVERRVGDLIFNDDGSITNFPAVDGCPLYTAFFDAAGIPNDGTIFFEGTAQEITGAAIRTAVNNLVFALQQAGIWYKFKAIYPFVGGTASSHKYNLICPADSDASFRITWQSSFDHTKTGVMGTTTDAVGNTNLIPSAELTLNDTHLSVYSRTNIAGGRADIGAYDDPNGLYMGARWVGDKFVGGSYSTEAELQTVTVADSRGFFVLSKTAGNLSGYKNGAEIDSTSSSSGALPDNPVGVVGSISGSGGEYSLREIAFASIGDGLTAEEVADLHAAVQAFQTALGRDV